MSRHTTVRSAVLIVATALALAACSPSGTTTSAPVVPDASETQGGIPSVLQFTSTTLKGEPFDGESLYGEATILWFWAPWCPSCAYDSKEVLAAIPDLPDGVQIIGVPTTSDKASMQEFAENFGVTGLTNIVDEDGSIWSSFKVPALPSSAVVYPDGTVIPIPGALSAEQLLEIAAKLAP